MRFHRKVVFNLCLGIVLFIATVFLTFPKLGENNKNEKVIKEVVKRIFTCPNKELVDLQNEMLDKILKASGDPKSDVIMESREKFDDLVEKIYAPYIAKEWYEDFREKFSSTFHVELRSSLVK